MPPFSIPPPLPPQNFAGLTDDELKAMEGNERANVEARIKCLRNIQVLLDAAVMEMQQYSSVVSQLEMTSLRRSEAMPRSSSSNSNAEAAASSSSSTPQEEPLSQPKSETGARPKVKPEKPKDNNCDSSEATNDDDEQDKVRKRRLERFEAQIE